MIEALGSMLLAPCEVKAKGPLLGNPMGRGQRVLGARGVRGGPEGEGGGYGGRVEMPTEPGGSMTRRKAFTGAAVEISSWIRTRFLYIRAFVSDFVCIQ